MLLLTNIFSLNIFEMLPVEKLLKPMKLTYSGVEIGLTGGRGVYLCVQCSILHDCANQYVPCPVIISSPAVQFESSSH